MKNIARSKSLQTVLWTTLLAAFIGVSACSNEPQETEVESTEAMAVEPTDMTDPETENMALEEPAPVATTDTAIADTDTGMTTEAGIDTDTDNMDTGMATATEEGMDTDMEMDTDTDIN